MPISSFLYAKTIEDAVKSAYDMRPSDMYGYIVVPVEDSKGRTSWTSFLTNNGEISLVGDLQGSMEEAARVAQRECKHHNELWDGCFRERMKGQHNG